MVQIYYCTDNLKNCIIRSIPKVIKLYTELNANYHHNVIDSLYVQAL